MGFFCFFFYRYRESNGMCFFRYTKSLTQYDIISIDINKFDILNVNENSYHCRTFERTLQTVLNAQIHS